MISSYVFLDNTGDLIVSSFTWAANIYPESANDGPLFNWNSNDNTNGFYGTHIWSLSQRLYLRVVDDGYPNFDYIFNTEAFLINQWSKLAVSYDADSGFTQVYVNGAIESAFIGNTGSHSTHGSVEIGTRYHFNQAFPDFADNRFYMGRMACVRLWNVTKDLNTLSIDTPHCNFL